VGIYTGGVTAVMSTRLRFPETRGQVRNYVTASSVYRVTAYNPRLGQFDILKLCIPLIEIR